MTMKTRNKAQLIVLEDRITVTKLINNYFLTPKSINSYRLTGCNGFPRLKSADTTVSNYSYIIVLSIHKT